MTDLACARKDCAIPGRHKTEHQPDHVCRGCLPALAQDGLRLCPLHTSRIATDALRCAELDGEIQLVLAATDRPGERTSGTANHGTELNPRAVDMRAELRHTLVAWTRLIHEQRGIHLPPDNLDAIAAYLATHHVWLAAHRELAGDCSDELSSLQRRAWNVAYPSGARVFPVGPCPTCQATVRVVLRTTDSLLPSELVCDGSHDTGCTCSQCPPHKWGAHQWHALGRQMTKAAR